MTNKRAIFMLQESLPEKTHRTSASTEKKCPVCSSPRPEIFLEMVGVPTHCNLLVPTYNEAINAPRGDIQLGFCRRCGHIYNFAFDRESMKYTQAYENSLHFSSRFQDYAESLARDLIERYDLHNKDVIEIGCGKGEFLGLLCKLGNNRGVGFDASYVPEHSDKGNRGQFTVIQDFYSERYARYKADFICCRHVLEHIESPHDFLTSVRESIGDRMETMVFFEVPNVLYTLRDLGIWDLIYEHCSYFSSSSLSCLFSSCGFKALKLSEFYERQFLGIEASPSDGEGRSRWEPPDDLGEISSLVYEFADNYRQKVESWWQNLKLIYGAGKRVVVWGGGSKGVTFLNALRIQDQIHYVIDINPRKHGMYVAGTGQRIVAPEFLRDYKPDVLIVMNPIYTDEIRRITAGLGLSPEYLYG